MDLRRPLAALAVTASVAGLAALVPSSPAPAAPAAAAAAESQRYIVVMDDAAPVPSKEGAGPARSDGRLRGAVAAARDLGDVEKVWTEGIEGFTAVLDPAEAAALADRPGVALVEPDARVRASVVQRRPAWNLDRIDQRSRRLNGVYGVGADGRGVTVFVIDSGLRSSHRDFAGRVRRGFAAGYLGTTRDCAGHGTHVAGTAVGTRNGVAKRASIVPVRVLDCEGSGWNSDIIDGMAWVAANAAGPSVVNMSLGGARSDAVNRATNGLARAGVTVVVAAGNERINACRVSPASAANTITVGAVDRADRVAPFSNRGPCVEIWAPGVDVRSAWITGNRATHRLDGTSMASPHVAGAAALFLERHQCAPWSTVRRTLLRGATSANGHRQLFVRLRAMTAKPRRLLNCNTGFEAGDTSAWAASGGVIDRYEAASLHGRWGAWIGGGDNLSERLVQRVQIPRGRASRLTFKLRIRSEESTSDAYDSMRLVVRGPGGAKVVRRWSNRDVTGGWVTGRVGLGPWRGRLVSLEFLGASDGSNDTDFLLDDVRVVR